MDKDIAPDALAKLRKIFDERRKRLNIVACSGFVRPVQTGGRLTSFFKSGTLEV